MDRFAYLSLSGSILTSSECDEQPLVYTEPEVIRPAQAIAVFRDIRALRLCLRPEHLANRIIARKAEFQHTKCGGAKRGIQALECKSPLNPSSC